MNPKPKTKRTSKSTADAPCCGLCGKKGKLTRTECCSQWICDDEHKYVLFSFATNSCHRNHRHKTLCAYHHNEGHPGRWQDCAKCREDFETEMYVWYGTNEYNFEKLENPPTFEPTRCAGCGAEIKLSKDGYSHGPGGYQCDACTEKTFAEEARKRAAKN